MFLDDGCSLVACVFIHDLYNGELTKQTIDGKFSVKINLLIVHPTMLNRGIARSMMQVIDAVAKNSGYTHVFLLVLFSTQAFTRYVHRVGLQHHRNEGLR